MLSVMAKGFFESSPLLIFPIAALLLFILVFTAITIRTLWTDAESLQQVAGLPLDDELPLSKPHAQERS